MATTPADLIERLARVTSAHDLDGIVGCFAADYANEAPAHPSRRFRGSAQVRLNWTQILAGVPDLEAQLLDSATNGNTVWSEWQMVGTRGDGLPYAMCGVIIFTVVGGLVRSARFYLEPVDRSPGTVNDAVHSAVSAHPAEDTA